MNRLWKGRRRDAGCRFSARAEAIRQTSGVRQEGMINQLTQRRKEEPLCVFASLRAIPQSWKPRMTSAAFCPPKPKLVETAVRTRISRAQFGT